MKKVFSLLLLTGLTLFLNLNSFGQAHLKIVSIDSFPQTPSDTAYEGIDYHNVRIGVTNTGNQVFINEINVFLYSQSIGLSGLDTLRDDPSWFQLDPGAVDTEYITARTGPGPPHYRFKTAHYAAGDNIIVVWPYSFGVNFDTYQTQVYFVPLTTAVRELDQTSLSLYPNPVSQIIHLKYTNEKSVDRVRIYDLVGREVFNVNEAVKTINVSTFNRGIYFLEQVDKDGNRTVNKILVTAE